MVIFMLVNATGMDGQCGSAGFISVWGRGGALHTTFMCQNTHCCSCARGSDGLRNYLPGLVQTQQPGCSRGNDSQHPHGEREMRPWAGVSPQPWGAQNCPAMAIR